MLDPLSVAGLAFAVFEALLKVGERTAEVISEMRSFDQVIVFWPHREDRLAKGDQDMKQLREKIRYQTWRMSSLQLLFRESQVVAPS